MSIDPLIREAIELAKAGHRSEARWKLEEVLRSDPEDADAMLVMAQIIEDRQQAIRYMREVVRLRPGDQKAQAYLAKLEDAEPKGKASPPKIVTEKKRRRWWS
jgi:cytochrome c-type biogenesis protein CcmH/NrfG